MTITLMHLQHVISIENLATVSAWVPWENVKKKEYRHYKPVITRGLGGACITHNSVGHYLFYIFIDHKTFLHHLTL